VKKGGTQKREKCEKRPGVFQNERESLSFEWDHPKNFPRKKRSKGRSVHPCWEKRMREREGEGGRRGQLKYSRLLVFCFKREATHSYDSIYEPSRKKGARNGAHSRNEGSGKEKRTTWKEERERREEVRVIQRGSISLRLLYFLKKEKRGINSVRRGEVGSFAKEGETEIRSHLEAKWTRGYKEFHRWTKRNGSRTRNEGSKGKQGREKREEGKLPSSISRRCTCFRKKQELASPAKRSRGAQQGGGKERP